MMFFQAVDRWDQVKGWGCGLELDIKLFQPVSVFVSFQGSAAICHGAFSATVSHERGVCRVFRVSAARFSVEDIGS